ncbi:TonB-dependent receptor [Alloacidobacterium sp.]|uniref:TonB-dependent receptor n=1 Tax=Alloacidobacterium sp. TaxID=2951999 RepID=UPI002D5C2EE4|nr:TonB-dependent receptor [Alloacidobacterium sp.]HYK35554.1 TonB-dependent receptor [Alloacidobacterium sp.]
MAKRYAICVLLFLFSLISPAFSQTDTTSLRGSIKDPSGAVVPGASVTLTDSATGKVLQATSSASGDYQFVQIPPAKYNVKVSATGFGEQTKSAELLVNQPATIDFAMTVQASTEVVNVSAEAQTLNTSDASLGNSMNNTLIQALPSEGRNVPDLLSLQPGVLYLGQDSGRPSNSMLQNDPRSGAVNGGRSDQGNIIVDGLDDNDQVNGYAFTGVLRETQDSVEEFRVTTGLSGADQGRSSGAQVSMVTKSGTNSYHGAVYWYNRPTLTVANDWFNKEAQLSSGEANRPPKLIRNNFGAAVGGPIFKDKLFFFGNYEGQRQAENQIVTRTAPTASYQQGILTYLSNGAPASISAAQVTALDGGCQVCNTSEYPAGPGPNPNVLAYYNQYPAANGTAAGDGLNTGSFTFSSPNPVTLNTSIARLDYTPNQKQRIFVRGNLQKDTAGAVEQFPGQPPSYQQTDNTKGIAAGYTYMFTPNLVNDLRYGYIRQGYGLTGGGTGEYTDFRFIDPLTDETRKTIYSVPVNNIVDNLSWTKGKHTLQFGGNWRLIHQNRGTDDNSYNSATSNPYWLAGNAPSPSSVGGAPLDSGFQLSYNTAYANLIGTIPQITEVQNYAISSPTSGSLLPEGAFINRNFKANEYEWYVQDAWHVSPKLILTLGLRQTILQTPWEIHGQQLAPTVDTHSWFLERASAAAQGAVFENDLSFAPNGPFYHKPGYWPKQKNNFAPRLSFAYSPDPKTSIRGGFGLYFDHYGEALVNTFSQQGSFGLSSSLSNPAGVYGYTTSPRYINRTTLPNISVPPAPPTTSFPYLYPQGNFAIQWGLDSKIKTPYSESMDLSVQRQLPAGFTVEVNYVGRLGRHLLQSLDIAEPVDYVDPQGGGDYFSAGAKLSHQVDLNGGNGPYSGNGQSVTVPSIQYFEDVFGYMAGAEFAGETATQAVYDLEWAPFRSILGATSALADLDFYCGSPITGQAYNCPGQPRFWQDQFSSLYVLSSMGTSYYNAGQLILRHPTSYGLSLDFSYTLAKSIDMGSDPERGTEFNGGGGNFSNITNTWKPELSRGVSDFDTRHLITADWVYQLPIGRGKKFMSSDNAAVDALIGGWQWSGINRWASALPFSLADPGWSTDWQISSLGVVTDKAAMSKQMHKNYAGGAPQVFADPNGINNGTATGSPVRLSYPGEAGQRNIYRADGIFGIDSGLSKSWHFGEYGALKFDWEVFNVTNSVRFNSNGVFMGQSLTNGNLGVYSAMQNLPRRMQFGLRYDF